MEIVAISNGRNASASFATANGYALTDRTGSGLRAAVLDASSNRLKNSSTFDTGHDTTASERLISWLEATATSGDVLILEVAGSVTGYLNNYLEAYIAEYFHSTSFSQLTTDSGYVLINQKNGGTPFVEGLGKSEISFSYSLACTDSPFVYGCVDLVVVSEGYDDGDTASVLANGEQLMTSPSRGLNVIVMDGTYTTLVKSQNFDTYGSTSESNLFATWIDDEVSTGDFLIIAAKYVLLRCVTRRDSNVAPTGTTHHPHSQQVQKQPLLRSMVDHS
jgi:hypothetical protein